MNRSIAKEFYSQNTRWIGKKKLSNIVCLYRPQVFRNIDVPCSTNQSGLVSIFLLEHLVIVTKLPIADSVDSRGEPSDPKNLQKISSTLTAQDRKSNTSSKLGQHKWSMQQKGKTKKKRGLKYHPWRRLWRFTMYSLDTTSSFRPLLFLSAIAS